jgi:hypothetical protein
MERPATKSSASSAADAAVDVPPFAARDDLTIPSNRHGEDFLSMNA